jgi:hypothetical protein
LEAGSPEDVDGLAERLTSAEITDWMGYFQAVHDITRGGHGPAPSFLSDDEIRAQFRAYQRQRSAA